MGVVRSLVASWCWFFFSKVLCYKTQPELLRIEYPLQMTIGIIGQIPVAWQKSSVDVLFDPHGYIKLLPMLVGICPMIGKKPTGRLPATSGRRQTLSKRGDRLSVFKGGLNGCRTCM